MKRHLLLALLSTIMVHQAALGQTSVDSVKQVINRFFEGMKSADTGLVRKTFSPQILFQTVGINGIRAESPDDFLKSVAKSTKGDLDERITFEWVQTDGNLASAWTPYVFYYQGKLHHCGVNSFQLVRQFGRWQIQYVIDTRRKTGCETR